MLLCVHKGLSKQAAVIMILVLTSIVSLLRKNEWTVMVGEANTGL